MAYAAILGQTGSSGILPRITIMPVNYTYTSVVLQNNDTSKEFTATYDGSNWVTQVDEYGTYTVTGTYSGGTKTETLDVEVNQEYQVSLGYTPVPTLNDNDWATISYASKNNLGESLWSIGDRKEIIINGQIDDGLTLNNYSTYVFILGFNHNEALEGQGISFGGFKSALSGGRDICLTDSVHGQHKSSGLWFNMNNSNSNNGGWEQSGMRNNLIPQFKSCLESDLVNVLKTVNKYTDNMGGGLGSVQSNITATQDQIFLLSEYEAMGVRKKANTYEQNYQKQYQYYIDGNSRVKYKYNSTSSFASWWLRSSSSVDDYTFCYFASSNDEEQIYDAYYVFGFAPAFCV